MTEHGIAPYDLADGWFCEECHRPKSYRLWPGTLTGCKTCNKVITRHRCTKRPFLDSLAHGESWTCPDCGGTWTAAEEEDTCGECGRSGMEKTWHVVTGDRIDSAPRYDPPPLWTPFRNKIPQRINVSPGPFGECYQMASGAAVHVRPGCRCPA